MNLNCPHCQSNLSPSDINLPRGLAFCPSCESIWKIADYLAGDQLIRQIPKPENTPIEIQKTTDALKIHIPARPNADLTWGMFFAAAILLIIWVAGRAHDGDWGMFEYLIPLMSIPILSTLCYSLWGTISAQMDQYETSVTWALWGFKHQSNYKTKTLTKIEVTKMYEANDDPVNGIGLFFGKRASIKFGSNLTKEEQIWLIGELQSCLADFSK